MCVHVCMHARVCTGPEAHVCMHVCVLALRHMYACMCVCTGPEALCRHFLCVCFSLHTQELGLSTMWDEDLCYLLGPALASYETERCLGVGGVGNQEFQDAIRNAVPDGHSFKGFPVQLLHRDPGRAFATCLRCVY